MNDLTFSDLLKSVPDHSPSPKDSPERFNEDIQETLNWLINAMESPLIGLENVIFLRKGATTPNEAIQDYLNTYATQDKQKSGKEISREYEDYYIKQSKTDKGVESLKKDAETLKDTIRHIYQSSGLLEDTPSFLVNESANYYNNTQQATPSSLSSDPTTFALKLKAGGLFCRHFHAYLPSTEVDIPCNTSFPDSTLTSGSSIDAKKGTLSFLVDAMKSHVMKLYRTHQSDIVKILTNSTPPEEQESAKNNIKQYIKKNPSLPTHYQGLADEEYGIEVLSATIEQMKHTIDTVYNQEGIGYTSLSQLVSDQTKLQQSPRLLKKEERACLSLRLQAWNLYHRDLHFEAILKEFSDVERSVGLNPRHLISKTELNRTFFNTTPLLNDTLLQRAIESYWRLDDPAAQSTISLYVTGRKGLYTWEYTDADGKPTGDYLIFCYHPNTLEPQLLFYPGHSDVGEIGRHSSLVSRFLNILPDTLFEKKNNRTIIRVDTRNTDGIKAYLNRNTHEISFDKPKKDTEKENPLKSPAGEKTEILDYFFPPYLLPVAEFWKIFDPETKAIHKSAPEALRDRKWKLPQKVAQMHDHVIVKPINFDRYGGNCYTRESLDLVDKWVTNRQSKSEEAAEEKSKFRQDLEGYYKASLHITARSADPDYFLINQKLNERMDELNITKKQREELSNSLWATPVLAYGFFRKEIDKNGKEVAGDMLGFEICDLPVYHPKKQYRVAYNAAGIADTTAIIHDGGKNIRYNDSYQLWYISNQLQKMNESLDELPWLNATLKNELKFTHFSQGGVEEYELGLQKHREETLFDGVETLPIVDLVGELKSPDGGAPPPPKDPPTHTLDSQKVKHQGLAAANDNRVKKNSSH